MSVEVRERLSSHAIRGFRVSLGVLNRPQMMNADGVPLGSRTLRGTIWGQAPTLTRLDIQLLVTHLSPIHERRLEGASLSKFPFERRGSHNLDVEINSVPGRWSLIQQLTGSPVLASTVGRTSMKVETPMCYRPGA
ncbi:MAG: hypothetical protein WD313_03730 [Acidimicrobiia bacterium]